MAHMKSKSPKGIFSERMKSKRVSKDCIIPELSMLFDFDKMCDANKTVSLGELLECFNYLTDAFITHEWGENKASHFFAMKINDFLKAKGLVTWFDEEKLEGNVQEKMTRGIDNAQAVLVCITPRYMQKVSGDNAGDNCKLEFGYASLRKTASKMLGAVVDPTVRDPTKWTGPVGMVMGPQMYVDLSDPALFEEKMNEVYNRLLGIIKVPVSVRIAEQLQIFQDMNSFGPSDISLTTSVFTADVMNDPRQAREETGGESVEFNRIVTRVQESIKLFSIIIDEFIILLFLIFLSVYFIFLRRNSSRNFNVWSL